MSCQVMVRYLIEKACSQEIKKLKTQKLKIFKAQNLNVLLNTERRSQYLSKQVFNLCHFLYLVDAL